MFLVCNVADGKITSVAFCLWLTIIIIKVEHIAVNMKAAADRRTKAFPRDVSVKELVVSGLEKGKVRSR